MAIDKIFNNANVDGIADNIFGSVNNSVSEVKQMQQRKAAENVQMVVEAFKKIETNITEKFDNVSNVIEKRVLTIKDGRDGINGKDGRDGKDGRNGKDGLNGKPGLQGPPGKDGIDGTDGVSVTDANIDFDGSLIINLSSGKQINAGEIISPELEKKIISVQHGGSSGSGGDVMGPTSATDNRIARFDGTSGKLIQSSAVTINNSGNVSGVGTLSATGLATLSAGAVIQGLTVGLGAGAVSGNTAVGLTALNVNTTGSQNTAVGELTLAGNLGGTSNTAVGSTALTSNTSGNQNTAVGLLAARSTTTGSDNVAIGSTALYSNTTFSGNIAIGSGALYSANGGSNSTVIGYSAGTLAYGGTNTFLGYSSGSAVTSGANNVIIGGYTGSAAPISATGSNWIVLSDGAGNVRGTFNSAGLFDVDGEANISGLTIGKGAGAISDNTAIGVTALNANTTGLSNTAIGYQSLLVNSTGYENASIGSYTLKANTFGNGNTAVGDAALLKNTTGVGNTAIGKSALLENLTGGGNVAVGYVALRDVTGSNNTAIGPAAGGSITTGSNNVVIGGYSGAAAPISLTGSNYIVLSDGAGTVRQTIDPSGNVSFTGSITSRVVVIADATSITVNADTTDVATQANTQAVGTLTINAPTGTPVNGQKFILRLRSTNVQTFSWNAIFQGSTDISLPISSSGATLHDYVGFIYNSTTSKWQMIAKVFGF